MIASSKPRLLLVVPQLPQDSTSGAARSVRTICEMLAASGFAVRALGTTGTEASARVDTLAYLRKLGLKLKIEPGRSGPRVRPEIFFEQRGISYRLLDIGSKPLHGWEQVHGRQFDHCVDDELRVFRPDFLFTFGGSAGDQRRHERARRQGTKIVFALRNEGYVTPGFFAGMDAVLTPSQYLTDFYRNALGIESTPIATPIEIEDILAEERDPIFFTMINPSVEKGLMVFARIAEEIGVRRPDIPILCIESRASAGLLVQGGLAGGFDLRRHENIMTSPSVPTPKDIYTPAKALLAPSLREASGRVVAEALVNGVPPLVSDRGGLAEGAAGGGFTIPLPKDLDLDSPRPVEPEVAEPWVELILRLEDDNDFYEQACNRAREAGRMYLREELAPKYVRFFHDLDRRQPDR